MQTKLFIRHAFMLYAASVLVTGCAVIPTCPGSLLPVAETRINNTSGAQDDYLTTTGFTPCGVRITNWQKFGGGNNFPGGVAVEIRNVPSATNLQFSASGSGAGSTSIFATIPQDGSFLTFYVKGTATSTVDKSAIIEIATAGATCNEVVITRQATMVPAGSPPVSASVAGPQVEIEIGSISHLDDYITWAPTTCRIKWSNPPNESATLPVRLQNMSGTSHLAFADSMLAGGATATGGNLNYTLKGDGSWANFYVAGVFNNASVTDKDAVIEVINTTNSAILSREALMVRIRKNANTLSAAERDRYLGALKKLDLTYNEYIDFLKTHSRSSTGSIGNNIAHRQAHVGFAFLPWHRAFILQFERLLQAADPSVALHYWKFDVNAPNILNQNFMGSNSSGNMATLAAVNPIVSWSLPGEAVPAGIQRKTPYGDAGHPTVDAEVTTLGLGGTSALFSSFTNMESSTHNPAHSTSAFAADGTAGSWIGGSPAIADRDPLFFFLHCNVDRLWAKWQWSRNRNDGAIVSSYPLQGSLTTPDPGVAAPNVGANRTLGQYASDTMWPWDNVTGGTGVSQRPDIAILTPFPIVIGAIPPGNKPTVKSMIDYLNKTGTRPGQNLNFAYDDFFPY